MQKSLEVLQNCLLFSGISADEMPAMLGCLGAQKRQYAKNQVIFAAGRPVSHVGIVLQGAVHVLQDDYWGNRTILAGLGPADLFGEAFSCAGIQRLPVNVLAAEKAQVMLIDYKKIVQGCSSGCQYHTRLVQNMLHILGQKNVALTQKIETITQRNTRGKLLAYLSGQAQKAGANSFAIPFNRQELADYLSVDRSAMSSELAKMQKEGLLQYHKNQFKLLGQNTAN